jgi:hypothetical protein
MAPQDHRKYFEQDSMRAFGALFCRGSITRPLFGEILEKMLPAVTHGTVGNRKTAATLCSGQTEAFFLYCEILLD